MPARIKTAKLPMMPLRGMLVFPYMVIHLDVGRSRSINAVEACLEDESNLIFLVMQKDPQIDEPAEDDVYHTGVVARVRQSLKLPGGTVRVLTECLYRAELLEYVKEDPYVIAKIALNKEKDGSTENELAALMRILLTRFEEYAKSDKRVPAEAAASLSAIENPGQFADVLASYLNLKLSEKQSVLGEFSVAQRMELLLSLITKEMDILELERKISFRVRQQMEKSQKEYYLREQIKAIQKELGDKDDRAAEVEELREKLKKARLPKPVQDKVSREIERLERMPPMVSEAMVVRNYIDWVLDLPWNKSTKDSADILAAEQILDEDHYGLEKVKERVLEYLAVRQLSKNLKGPILCFVGPPGVGKTSLARSIARALGRKFVRVSLGGVRDEAEIRGHRRTYIGSMPGRIIQGLKQAGANNPVFLLDEIDKLSSDFRGDPSSALLEALDPEQNVNFSDHYIETPFDLSKVIFITTANVQHDIPRPLLDRMEIIGITSYTEEEKLQIALRHLLRKQYEEHSLKPGQLTVSENALRRIIREYTREAGVRELERKIAKICRRVSRDIVAGEQGPYMVNQGNVPNYLGVPRYRYRQAAKEPMVGVATGLAWTEIGGDLLCIEVKALHGKGKCTITGHLGDVMKESAQAGFTYIRSVGAGLGIADNIDETTDLHIHVPEGAIPKDGPSAGITIASAIASELSGRPVRADIAMTGEVTLRGRVLPVGGIKEKVLAAFRGGCYKIIMPAENQKDLEDISPAIRKKMKFHFVNKMDEVLELALLPAENREPAPDGVAVLPE